MKIFLHCCCAPCSLFCVKNLLDDGFEPALFWYNPNIHLYTEYKSRRDCLKTFADNENLNLKQIDEYGLRPFLTEVLSNGDSAQRCQTCCKMRLKKTAAFAAQEGFNMFSTTLLISPYQDHELIKTVGEKEAAEHGIEFFYRDFRAFFKDGQAAARSRNMYMQKYCGCIFSEEDRYVK